MLVVERDGERSFLIFFYKPLSQCCMVVHISIARTYTEESVAEKASKITILVVSSLMLFLNPKFNLGQLCQLPVYSNEYNYPWRITPSSPAIRDNELCQLKEMRCARCTSW